jgi:hypothetical protein
MIEIVVWGAVALTSAIAGAILAKSRNRNMSSWAAWCLLLPPLVGVLYLLPKTTPAAPRPPLVIKRRAE